MLAGPSNAGLEEPGQNAAITLSQLTVVLPQAPFDLDTLVKMQVLNLVTADAVKTFVTTARKLAREEREIDRQEPVP
jgi:hypothetical protein